MATYNVHGGHCPEGSRCPGAAAILNESREDRKVKNRVIDDLRKAGNTVYDCTDDSMTHNQDQNLAAIVAKCNQHTVDVDMSIHLNSGRNDLKGDKDTAGVEAYVYSLSNASMVNLAKQICESISRALGIDNRGVKTEALYVLRHTKNKAMLIECAFVDDKDDANHWDAVKCGDAIAAVFGAHPAVAKPAAPIDPDGTIIPGGALQSNLKDVFGKISYAMHVRDIGNLRYVCDGQIAGSTGQNRRIEGMYIKAPGQMDVGLHIADKGDTLYKNIKPGQYLGTTDQKLRIESFCIWSQDTLYKYRAYQKNKGWSGWCYNGTWAGVKGQKLQIEAIEIEVVTDIPTVQAYSEKTGWGSLLPLNGSVAGTTGQALAMCALRINPCGLEISVKAHIAELGWKDYGEITKDTVIGLPDKGDAIECICLKGTFEYRLHLAESGWTPWTKADGTATLGTVGQALAAEAIQFRLL